MAFFVCQFQYTFAPRFLAYFSAAFALGLTLRHIFLVLVISAGQAPRAQGHLTVLRTAQASQGAGGANNNKEFV